MRRYLAHKALGVGAQDRQVCLVAECVDDILNNCLNSREASGDVVTNVTVHFIEQGVELIVCHSPTPFHRLCSFSSQDYHGVVTCTVAAALLERVWAFHRLAAWYNAS